MGKQLISTVTTGTAQLQIASTTAVPNLNAAFWTGYSGDRFFDSASCIQNRTTQQAGSNFSIDGNGSLGGGLSGLTVDRCTGYRIGGDTVLSVRVSNGSRLREQVKGREPASSLSGRSR